jgi:hypothetical protein
MGPGSVFSASRKKSTPSCHSGGAATWHLPLASVLTFQPSGMGAVVRVTSGTGCAGWFSSLLDELDDASGAIPGAFEVLPLQAGKVKTRTINNNRHIHFLFIFVYLPGNGIRNHPQPCVIRGLH